MFLQLQSVESETTNEIETNRPPLIEFTMIYEETFGRKVLKLWCRTELLVNYYWWGFLSRKYWPKQYLAYKFIEYKPRIVLIRIESYTYYVFQIPSLYLESFDVSIPTATSNQKRLLKTDNTGTSDGYLIKMRPTGIYVNMDLYTVIVRIVISELLKGYLYQWRLINFGL